MNSAPETPPWTRRRWAAVIALLFFAQVGLAFLFASRAPMAAQPESSPITYRFLPPDSALPELLASDPTFFVLPDRRDFFGPSSAHQSSETDLAEWSEPPRWLPLSVDQLGTAVVELARSPAAKPPAISEKRPPQSPLEVVLPTVPLRTASQFRLEGDLKARLLVSSVTPLPSWPHSDLLADSVIEVTANGAGQVVSVRLIRRSGLPDADQHALQAARALRFAPLIGTPSLSSGRLIVQWHTIAPAPDAAAPEAATPTAPE